MHTARSRDDDIVNQAEIEIPIINSSSSKKGISPSKVIDPVDIKEPQVSNLILNGMHYNN